MELKQNPFSLYDFLGYFTPGAIFIYGFMALSAHLGVIQGGLVDAISFEKRQMYVPFVLASYTVGQLLSFISSIFIEKYTVWLTGYPSKYLLNVPAQGYFSINKIVRLGVGLFLTPISLLEIILNWILRYRATYTQPLDGLLIKIIKAKTDALLLAESGLTKMPSDTHASSTDFFRFAYHYAVETAPNHFPKMQNYVAIYGFLRTMSLISVLFFWAIMFHLFTNELTRLHTFCILLAVSFLSFTFYMSFVKFWRRFTLEALMAIATTYKMDKKVNPDTY